MSVLRTEYVMTTRLTTICIRRDLDNEMWNHLQFHGMYTNISTYTWDLDRSNISWTSKPNVSVHSHQKVPTQFQFNWVFARKNLTINLLGASWNSFCWGYKKNLEISHVEPKNCGWKMMFLSVWKIFQGASRYFSGLIFCKLSESWVYIYELGEIFKKSWNVYFILFKVVPPSIGFSVKKWTLEDHSLQKVCFFGGIQTSLLLLCLNSMIPLKSCRSFSLRFGYWFLPRKCP